MAYLGQKNIAHRDLKPENILLEENEGADSLIKVINFGNAIYCKPPKKIKGVVGTPLYMAPEVNAGLYDFKCDVWSCGVILHILITERPPFDGSDDFDILVKASKY